MNKEWENDPKHFKDGYLKKGKNVKQKNNPKNEKLLFPQSLWRTADQADFCSALKSDFFYNVVWCWVIAGSQLTGNMQQTCPVQLMENILKQTRETVSTSDLLHSSRGLQSKPNSSIVHYWTLASSIKSVTHNPDKRFIPQFCLSNIHFCGCYVATVFLPPAWTRGNRQ